ncbi:MAG: hypothetical protein HQ562_00650 [Candidatus Marinimicrobia bacterium]|nr:hypothetical protein [Candidatus Neomarinimicrobiota bacterium]
MFKTKTKAGLILIGTLVLGIIIGVLGSRYLVEKRIGRMAGMRYQKGFIEVFIRLIDPAEDQEQAVRAVLEKHHDRFLKIMEGRMVEIRTSMDSLKVELIPLLTEEQCRIFEERFMNKRMGRWSKPPGFSPGKPDKHRPKLGDRDHHRKSKPGI